ncbi:EamA family transporter [Candidatus Woesearchaeota archaeon]|nr:EamA family transporter [Candidatus Woesearchaeota archaeon]
MAAWLFYALMAPVIFAVLNLLDKVLRDKHFSTLTMNVTAGFFSVVAVLGFLLVDYDLPLSALLIGLFGGVVWFLAGFPYFKALSVEEVSRVIPLWQLQSPITLVMAAVFLGEKLTSLNYASFALITAGAFLISVKNFSGMLKVSLAFYLILIAAIGTSAASVIAKGLYSSNSHWPVQIALLLGGFAGAAAVMLFSGKLRAAVTGELKKSSFGAGSLLILRQLVGMLAFVLLNLAILTGPVSLTIAISGLSSFFVLIGATALSLFWPSIIREVVDRKTLLTKAVAIAMIIAGLFLLAK